MKTKITLPELSIEEIGRVAGGSDDETSIWYKIGKFFAEQANANDSIREQYGNTNHNR